MKTLFSRPELSAGALLLACLFALLGAGSAAAATHRPTRAQIIGGQPVPAGTLPQLAYIVNQVSPTDDESCTGTVLSANLVLTAAHCVQSQSTGAVDPAAGFSVVTGQPNLAGSLVGHVSAVSNVIVYPLYDPVTRDSDAALLELSTPTTAPAVTLPTSADATLWQSGAEVAMAGWGLTNGADPASEPYQVQWATTVTQSSAYCASNALLLESVFDPAGQICAIDAPADTTGACHGDSGGPLLAQYWTGTPIQVGITVWGEANCNPAYPNFFTQTAPISSWAANWIQNLAPPPAPSPAPTPTATPTRVPTSVSASTPARQAPRAGSYHGHSSQHHAVRFTVVSAATSVTSLTFGLRLRCGSGRRLSYTLRTKSFPIHHLAFGGGPRTSGQRSYQLTGRFDTTGRANGTIKTSWRSRRYGSCQSGVIHWNATS